MACAGIDFGSRRSVVAIARRGGVDICANEVSNRSTPSLVSFAREQRHIGEAAANFQAQNPKNTVAGIQRLLGVVHDSAFARDEAARLTANVVPTAAGGAAVSVAYGAPDDQGEIPQVDLSFESLAGMLFSSLLKLASDEYKAPVKDCVITVPGYFTEGQRRAVMDAAAIGNVNVLRVLNEHAAVALSYGIFRTAELPATDPVKVAFVDMGDAGTTVCIAAFTKARADVLSVAFEPSLGGRDFDLAIANVFARQFKEKYGVDAMSRPRPKLRLLKEAEKVKRILSANAQAPINIECLMDDIDVSSSMTREEFEELIAPLIDRFKKCCVRAIAAAKLAPGEKLLSVEIVGASTRVPAVKRAVTDTFEPLGAPMKTTLNMDECVARGAALMSAILSPAFRVREYGLSDVCPYAVDAEKVFESDSPSESLTLIPSLNQVPCVKAMSFKAPGPLTLNLSYSDPSVLTQGEAAAAICSYKVDAPLDSDAKVRAKIRMNESGLLEVSSVTLSKEVEVEVEDSPKKAESSGIATTGGAKPEAPSVPAQNGVGAESNGVAEMKTSDGPSGAANGEAGAGDLAPMAVENEKGGVEEESDADKAAQNESNAKCAASTAKRVVKKVEQTDVPYVQTARPGVALSLDEVNAAVEREAQMKASDLYLKERSDALNGLEGYVYDLRSRIGEYGDLRDFGAESVRVPLQKELDEVEEWIYSDEGDKASKSVFTERKSALIARAAPLMKRKREADERPSAVKALESVFESYKKIAVCTEEYSHVPESEKEKALKCVETAALWLNAEVEKQNALPLSVDPVLTCEIINAKRAEVDAVCLPIQNTPKPEPPKVEAAEQKPSDEKPKSASAEGDVDSRQENKVGGKDASEARVGETGADAATKTPAAGSDSRMDVDEVPSKTDAPEKTTAMET